MTEVDYFIFDEYEIHLNRIPPNCKQDWHRHTIIEEVIVMIDGEVSIRWKENEELKSNRLTKGSVVRVKKSMHTVENITNNWAEFIVFRMVPSGENKKDIIKNDKIIAI